MTITLVNGDFQIPREGIGVIMERLMENFCEGCPAGTGVGTPAATVPTALYLALVTNNPPVSAALEFADLVISDATGGTVIHLNNETPPTYCLGNIEGPSLGLDGEWQIIFDQQIWTITAQGTTDATAFGIALLSGTSADRLVAYAPIEGGPAPLENGDLVKFTGSMRMLPVIDVDLTPP